MSLTPSSSPNLSNSWFALQQTRRQHEHTGFWGPPNANHEFCEPHYVVTPYIAEFYNTISSFLFVAVAYYIMVYDPKLVQDRYVLASVLTLAAIGFGSAAFHATMRYNMQLCDEIPMIFFVTFLVLGMATTRPKNHILVPSQRSSTLWVVGTILWAATVVAIYIIFDAYGIFVFGFMSIAIVNIVFVLSSPLHPTLSKQHSFCRTASIGLILIGKVFWWIEHGYCTTYPYLYPLHVAWHTFSCASAYYSVLALYFTRCATTTSTKGKQQLSPSQVMPKVWGVPSMRMIQPKKL